MTGCTQYVFYSIENIKKRMFKREKLFYLILLYWISFRPMAQKYQQIHLLFLYFSKEHIVRTDKQRPKFHSQTE